ncbi:siphovirus ReqiPepy6 Gp37-like family protein [Paenalkalicoccus suaedae]|uniref:Siphovirus ReqiPepy6 Gp37-like family protein n=1 Tax=Paenalkalicoccus suaedae TaxID=2592382 RepID=A0A859FG46_9BACI|nr:siphovirus ReqiPepy6 Gp37-like family protein [Paenalkalicoccus suaedae]QKS71652.1 siphovirus ReqiPepy6 Gp37-like family protein [Paenalkalicoccus suaedae]QKS71704.1 siphovirus ReqiPepy6 Gp37-like family protein [Paenalkalicoccus suaedae]
MRKPIRVIDQSFLFLGDVDLYESLKLTRRFYTAGELEVKINRHKKGADLLKMDRIVFIQNQLHKAYLIRSVESELDQAGKITENIIVRAQHVLGFLSRVLTLPPTGRSYDYVNSNAETIIKTYIDNNVINSPIEANNNPILQLAPDEGRGTQTIYQTRFKNLLDECADIADFGGIGMRASVNFDAEKVILDVAEGVDRTADQDEVKPVIFSPDPTYRSLKAANYFESNWNFRNVAIVAGQGEGIDRTIVEVDQSEGGERYEVFVDARDVEEEDEDGEPIPEQDIIDTLVARGEQALNDLRQEVYFEGEALRKSSFVYEVDYDLGDIVTIQVKEWGISFNDRIVECVETYSQSGFDLDLKFGKTIQTTAETIKKLINRSTVEART